MVIVLQRYRSGSKTMHDLIRARVRTWLLAQEEPVTSQDASTALDIGLSTAKRHLDALALSPEFRSAKVTTSYVNGKPAPRWRYYGRFEVMGEVKEWRLRGADIQEEREIEELSGPKGIMWRVLEEALVDAARATEREEREDLWAWFAGQDPSYLYSCPSICAVLDLDQWAILERLRQGEAGEMLRRIREMRKGRGGRR